MFLKACGKYQDAQINQANLSYMFFQDFVHEFLKSWGRIF